MHDDWDEHLHAAEATIKNAWQDSVCNTAFFLHSGQLPLTTELGTEAPAAQA